jgi:S-adenosyl-L-methionine hydrolase (adenosine-forming)
MPKPILTLTTDFGTADHYVAAMKGVILGICPQAQIVDICHEVAAFEILEGAYTIAQAYPCFPRKTVHVVVVDPGVGSARRPILMEAAGQYFVAPDNGVLAMIYGREKHKIRLISQDRYFRQPVSRTFHGRDIFSPVAAHLAAGVPAARMGKLIHDYLRPGYQRAERTGKRTWVGRILKIDHFGNVITSFHVEEFPNLEQRAFSLEVGGHELEVLARHYAEAAPGELVVIVGSGGYLEVSMNQGSAARQMGCQTGAAVELKLW